VKHVTIQVDLSLQFGSLSPGTGAPIVKKWEEFFQDQVSIVAIIGRSINMTINLNMIDFTTIIAMCSFIVVKFLLNSIMKINRLKVFWPEMDLCITW